MADSGLSVDDIMEKAGGVSRATVLSWIKEGKLRATKKEIPIKNKQWRIEQEDWDAFVKAAKISPG